MSSEYMSPDIDVLKLLKEQAEMQDVITNLQNKLRSTQNSLDVLLSSQKIPRKYVNKKIAYYHQHKNDKNVVEAIALFKETFPNVKVPWMFVKSITDSQFDLHNESN